MQKETIINELYKLISKDESGKNVMHSDEIWRADPEMHEYISSKMHQCTVQLISAIENNSSKRDLKRILTHHLKSFKRIDYDTEDAEFICECFEILAGIVNVRFGDNIMRWLYGSVLWLLLKTVRIFRPEKTISTQRTPCTNCGTELLSELKQRGNAPEPCWIIGKCLNCEEYNLLDSFSGAKKTSYTNFYPTEYYKKDECNEEQIKVRLEQIKFWRK